MSRIFTSGAEFNDVNEVGLTPIGSPTVVSSPVRSGAFAFQLGNGKSVNPTGITYALALDYYVRAYIYIGTLPNAAETVLTLGASSAGVYNVLLNTDGTLNLRSGSTVIGSASPALALNRWYRIELQFRIGSGSGDDSGELRVDGVSIASETAATRAAAAPASVNFGSFSAGTNSVVYYDDLGINDGNPPSPHNTFPGEGSVVLLRPTSDNAGGTGWTLGTGTALGGNGFAAEDNSPPVGVADLAVGSDPKQIRNASNNANVSYDANVATYQSAGIQPLDTVNIIVAVVATAAPVGTSAKAGTIGCASNPAIGNVALSTGGTSGAFWSGVAAGTYPTGWKWSFGTFASSPSVTVSTAPVMRITQVTASTRIAMVCAMGLYVDFTPHSTPANSIKGAQTDGHARVPSLYGPPM